jgi:AbiV family abortive infection protein
LANAHSLLADAELLLGQGRWPRAVALSILAIEEASKPSLIRAVLLARNEAELRQEWRAFRSHVQKNVGWILPEIAAERAQMLDDLRPIFDPDSDHPQVLEAIKQAAIYSDAYGDCHWSQPGHVFSQAEARSFVNLARLLAGRDREGAMTSEPELQLWVKHMRPVWKGPVADMKHALALCYAEAEQRGVLRGGGSASDMVKFLF